MKINKMLLISLLSCGMLLASCNGGESSSSQTSESSSAQSSSQQSSSGGDKSSSQESSDQSSSEGSSGQASSEESGGGQQSSGQESSGEQSSEASSQESSGEESSGEESSSEESSSESSSEEEIPYGDTFDYEGFKFEIIEDNGEPALNLFATLADSMTSELVIPATAEYEGKRYPVVKIADSVGTYTDVVESLVIPEGVKYIGREVFAYSSSLTKLSIPSSLEEFGVYAFDNIATSACTEKDGALYLGNEKNPYIVLYGIKDKNITELNIPEGARVINYGVCYLCEKLTTVTMPNSVAFIGYEAFCDCVALSSIKLSNSLKTIPESMLYDCMALEEIELPESVTHIDKYAFTGCDHLKKLVLSDNLTYIGDDVFDACLELETTEYKDALYLGSKTNPYLYLHKASKTDVPTYEIHNDTKFIGSSSFEGCALQGLELSDNIISIGSYAFKDTRYMISMALPNSIHTIGQSAFSDSGIERVTLPENITEISAYLFDGCANIEKINIPDGVEKIWQGAFRGCSKLSEVKIPESTMYYSENIFKDCSSLKSLTVSANMKEVAETSFTGIALNIIVDNLDQWINFPSSIKRYFMSSVHLLDHSNNDEIITKVDLSKYDTVEFNDFCFQSCVDINEVIFSDKLEVISKGMFKYCRGLADESFSIDGEECNIIKIDDGAFTGCEGLVNFRFPETVEEIGQSAFANCYNLESILFTNSLQLVNSYCFSNCSKLKKVYFYGTQEDATKVIIYADGNYSMKYTNNWYYFTSKGASETAVGRWWYFGEGYDVIEVVNK